MPYGTNGYDAAGTPMALVGHRNRHDSARLRRSGERGNDDRTDLARSRVLRPRAFSNSQVAHRPEPFFFQTTEGNLASAAGGGLARASVSPGE